MVTARVGRTGETRLSATETDSELEALGWSHRQIVVDNTIRDLTAARNKARALMAAARLPTLEYEAEIAGHGVGRFLLAPDTMVRVRDASAFLDNELMYCIRRSFGYDRKNGAFVKVGCVRPNLWVPGGEA